jgi:hypothetical protein
MMSFHKIRTALREALHVLDSSKERSSNRLIKKDIKTGTGVLTFCVVMVSCLAMPALGQKSASVLPLSDLAVVKDVTFTSHGKDEVIAVIVDRPFVYSYYHLTNPLRVVVDLTLTVPGTYTEPLTYQGGLVKQVRFVKHDLASGLLTRMECILVDGTDFTVKMSHGDDRKLILSFAESPNKPINATPTFSATVEKFPIPKPAGTPTVSAEASENTAAADAKSAPPAVSKKAPVAVSVEPASSGATGLNLTAIVVTPEGVDIITDGPLTTYTAFSLTKPDRMVVDLPGVRNGISAGKVPIGAFGITRARLGRYEGKSRIVFDGATDSILRAKLIKTGTGLRLLPAAPGSDTP